MTPGRGVNSCTVEKVHERTAIADHLYDQATLGLILMLLYPNIASIQRCVSITRVDNAALENRQQCLGLSINRTSNEQQKTLNTLFRMAQVKRPSEVFGPGLKLYLRKNDL